MDSGGWTTPDGVDSFELFVQNQATQDPGGAGGPYGPYGWGYSVSYMLITYDTAPTGGSSLGDPMNVNLELGFSGVLYVAKLEDEYFLDVGYALGTGLTDYDPVLDDPNNEPNPGLDQFDTYSSYNAVGVADTLEEPTFGAKLEFAGVIGDQVQVLLALSSFSFSFSGYAYAEGTLSATVSATEKPISVEQRTWGGIKGLYR
jgi:hypothetical protein